MSKAATQDRPNPRFDVRIDADLGDWTAARIDSRAVFGSKTHAVTMAITRVLEELRYMRARCKQEGLPFVPKVYWSLVGELIAASRPNEMGRPGRDSKGRPMERFGGYIDVELVQEILPLAEPDGPFDPDNPLAHVTIFGLRTLEAAERPDAIIGATFPFDGEAKFKRYRRALEATR